MYRIIAALLCSLLVLGACGPENPSGSSEENTESSSEKNTEKTSEETNDSYKLTFPVISRGEKVSLSEHVAAGKYTVFKFTADW